jgi:hypothetical protein
MAIKSFELATLDAKRFMKPGPGTTNVRIDHNSTVTLMTALSDTDASIDFRFSANYRAQTEEVIGVIKIEGNLVYQGKAREVVKQWSSTQNMPPEVANEVHNAIMSSCIPEAVLLARDIRLPPPIPMPQVQVQVPPKPGKRAGPEVF